jgi:hypothetical protein
MCVLLVRLAFYIPQILDFVNTFSENFPKNILAFPIAFFVTMAYTIRVRKISCGVRNPCSIYDHITNKGLRRIAELCQASEIFSLIPNFDEKQGKTKCGIGLPTCRRRGFKSASGTARAGHLF